jgi:hypothetical protein
VAQEYRLIPEETCPVVVDYRDAFSLLDNWIQYPSQEKWRKLQPFMVNIYEWELKQAVGNGWAKEVENGLYMWLGGYDEVRGILREVHDPLLGGGAVGVGIRCTRPTGRVRIETGEGGRDFSGCRSESLLCRSKAQE